MVKPLSAALSFLALMQENAPRQSTWVYVEHRIRAYLETHAVWTIPSVVGLALLGFNTFHFSDLWSELGGRWLIGEMGCSYLSGWSGASALWGLVEPRLLQFLDIHPQSQEALRLGYRLPARSTYPAPFVNLGEVHPERLYDDRGGYLLNHTTAERFSAVPEWCVLEVESLVTGLLILGAIGSGKTAYVLRPAVFGLFDHPSRPGGLVMDSKAALVEPLKAALTEAGRGDDLLPIGPHQPTKWNPFHAPTVSASTLADYCLSCVENINGAPYTSESRWIRNGSMHLLEGVIGLLRLRFQYVTAIAIREVFQLLVTETAGSGEPGLAVRAQISALFAGTTTAVDHAEDFQHFSGLVVNRMSEDEKFRTIYITELMQMLVPLTSPGVRETFNSEEAELNMPSWPEAIQNGLIVVLDCNSKAVPALGLVLGMMLKLGYQQTMMSRVHLARQSICNNERYMALVIDEYQEYASHGDAEYAAVCRESKSITCFATQGFDSISSRLGKDRAAVLVQSMRNLLVLTQSLPEWASKAIGEHEILEAERTVQETSADAQLSSTGRFAGKASVAESQVLRRQRKFVVTPEALKAMPTGQAILLGFDGRRAIPAQRIYFRPYFDMHRRAADHFTHAKATNS